MKKNDQILRDQLNIVAKDIKQLGVVVKSSQKLNQILSETDPKRNKIEINSLKANKKALQRALESMNFCIDYLLSHFESLNPKDLENAVAQLHDAINLVNTHSEFIENSKVNLSTALSLQLDYINSFTSINDKLEILVDKVKVKNPLFTVNQSELKKPDHKIDESKSKEPLNELRKGLIYLENKMIRVNKVIKSTDKYLKSKKFETMTQETKKEVADRAKEFTTQNINTIKNYNFNDVMMSLTEKLHLALKDFDSSNPSKTQKTINDVNVTLDEIVSIFQDFIQSNEHINQLSDKSIKNSLQKNFKHTYIQVVNQLTNLSSKTQKAQAALIKSGHKPKWTEAEPDKSTLNPPKPSPGKDFSKG